MMKKFFLIFLAGISLAAAAQTHKLSGHVYNNADESEILIGVHVIYGPGTGVVTNLEGNYSIDLQPGEYEITFSYVGFEHVKKTVNISNRNVILNVGLEPISIGEVTVVADVARSRETPIAFSTITPAELQEELAAQDIPLVLNSTPGVYATQEGGGDGDAQVTIRGFSSRNVGVLLDGVPVNDMETGHVYWSNWFGLDAVTRSIQVQRGLGASKLALPSVGGTINIITKGLENKKEANVKQEVGSDGYLRTSFGVNTGELKNGWAFSAAGSYKRGDGWVDQTWTKGFFYYLKIDKKIGKHIISASAYGAPQSHGQRAYQLPAAVFDSAYAERIGIKLHYEANMSPEEIAEVDQNRSNADEGIGRGLRYNQHWGYLARTKNNPNAKPEPISERVNEYHKPQITLKDFWRVNDYLYISNIAYMSIGRGGGIREKGTIYPGEDGLKNFQDDYDRNIGIGSINTSFNDSLREAYNYLRKLVNEHLWYGLLSTVNFRPDYTWDFSAGIDLRSYKGIHYEQIYDLLGADYSSPTYIDYSAVKDWTVPNPLKDWMLYEGDIDNYHNDGLVRWGGLFFQTEFKKDKISSFINLTGALSSYKRVDHFYGLNTAIVSRETEWNTFPGITIKGGLNYNFTEHMNAFFNAGYMSKAPRFSNVYDRNNTLFFNTENELIKAVEGGYSYSSARFSANLNAYYTVWENKPQDYARKAWVEIAPKEFEEYSINIKGMDALHKGIELDFIFKITSELDLQGLVSIGDWRWNSEDSARVYDDNENLVALQYFDATGVHVGNSAQTQFGGEIRWEPIKNLYIKPSFIYFADYYAEFDPISLNGLPESYTWYDPETQEHGSPRDSWKVPSYGLLDFHSGYRFKLGENSIQLRGSILNVLNTKYIATAQNNDTYNGQDFDDFDAKSAAVFFGMGRRFTLSIQYLF